MSLHMCVHACVHCLSMDNWGSVYFLAIANSATVNMEMNLLPLYLDFSYFVFMVYMLFSV